MAVIIGFGSTEEQFVRDEERLIREHLSKRAPELAPLYNTDELIADLRSFLQGRADELHKLSATYKKASDYPERYSEYWPTVISDASHIVVILRLHHINRRHALSPDGWALWSRTETLLFEHSDLTRELEAA